MSATGLYEIVIELTSGLTMSTEPQQAEPDSGRRPT
jgi:hypothetical protein